MARKIMLGIALFVSLAGCKKSDPENGFKISSADVIENSNGVVLQAGIPRPGDPVSGDFVRTQAGDVVTGTRQSYNEHTGTFGSVFIDNGKAPAFWNHFVTFPTPCGAAFPGSGIVFLGIDFFGAHYEAPNLYTPKFSDTEWECVHLSTAVPGASTRLVIRDSMPGSLTLYSGDRNFTSTYGMPVLSLFNPDATLGGTATASSIASDGSYAVFPFPRTPAGGQLTSNMYGVNVSNINSAGGYDSASFNVLSVADHQTFTTPYGVAAAWNNSTYYYSQTSDPYGDGTCAGITSTTSGSSSSEFPVVSLYSANAVMVGSTTVPVGTRPTTLVGYAHQTTDDFEDTGCQYNSGDYMSETTTDQLTRAVVSNSGSDSVSILDLVGNANLATIPVGHIPSGIAISPDETRAYVANFGDGTVSSVDLNAYTVVNTVYVGSQPSSVATTSDGSVWVGGNGYLFKLTSNLGLVGTYATSGKTVRSLSMGNSVGVLAVTATDASGNVVMDEVNTASTVQQNSYVASASHLVSSLGTYVNSQNQTVRSYAYTTVNAPASFQGSVPTLVVNDGWISISATPTGFAVTDLVSHASIMQITTPAPVTGLAVDPNLHTAYVALADANELLTVPLPNR